LGKIGEQFTEQLRAWDALTKIEVHWKRYEEALRKKEVEVIFKERAEAALNG
jgi:hypothetical protein